MKWIRKQAPAAAALLAVLLLGSCFALSGISAKAEPAPAANGDLTSTTALSAATSGSDPEPEEKPTVRFEAELLAYPVPLAEHEPAAQDEEDAPEEETAPEEPVLTPVAAQYAAETVNSSAQTTHIPENLAACTAGVEIPDDLERIDSFIATAYYLTGNTSTGAYTTVGRTLAVNPNVIPYGTEVWMFLDDGTYIGTFTAEDTGSNMMAHPHVVDIYMGADSYDECILWGAQHVNLYTVPVETE